LQLAPDYPAAYAHLGSLLMEADRLTEAEAAYRRALELIPDDVDVHNNLGVYFMQSGRLNEAEASFQQALLFKPDFAEVRWLLAMVQISIMNDANMPGDTGQSRFHNEIIALDRWFDAERVSSGFQAVGVSQPFYLAYREINNRDTLSQYGALCARLMKHWQDKQIFHTETIKPAGIVRVGIVSAHLYGQSVWDAIVKGWFKHLDSNVIELHVFHLGLSA
jgi:tetratricopeptide (TPR) repeat protein